MRTRPERPFKRSWQQTEPNARLLNPSPKEAWRSNSVRTEAWCLRETLEHPVALDADVRLVVKMLFVPKVPSCYIKEHSLVDGYKIVTTTEIIRGEARLKADYSSIAAERNEVRVKKPPHIYRVLMTIRDAVVGKSDRLTQRSPTTADFQSLFKSNARAFPSVYR
jgi:hypothetical protein